MSRRSDFVLSCWVTEAARSIVQGVRGQQEVSVKSAARARILASLCAAEKVKIIPGYASEHAGFLAQIAGSDDQMGALGMIFLHRIGAYIDAHTEELLGPQEHLKLKQLGAAEEDEVNQALMSGRLFPPPAPRWPEAPESKVAGRRRARFAILGDPHVGLSEENAPIISALEEMARAQADLVIAIGDLTRDGRQEHFFTARKILDQSPMPVAVTLGNHDLWARGEGPASGLERFTAAFDVKPYSVHEHNGVRMIVLNSADPARSPFSPYDMTTGQFKDELPQSVPGGTLPAEVTDWMKGLEAGPPTFIALHHPPYPYLGMPPLIFGLDEPSTGHLADLAARVRALAIFCGHSHRCHLSFLREVPVIEVASCNDWPFGYSMVEVTEEGWSFNLRPISHQPDMDPASHKDYLFRRYATGPQESRSFAAAFEDPSRQG